jgi:hypothetical protein
MLSTTHLDYALYPYYNYAIQFFIIYVPGQQLQGQLQAQRSADIHNYINNK